MLNSCFSPWFWLVIVISETLFAFLQGCYKCSFTLQGSQCHQITFYFYTDTATNKCKHKRLLKMCRSQYHYTYCISSLYVSLNCIWESFNDNCNDDFTTLSIAEPAQPRKAKLDSVLLHTSLINLTAQLWLQDFYFWWWKNNAVQFSTLVWVCNSGR